MDTKTKQIVEKMLHTISNVAYTIYGISIVLMVGHISALTRNNMIVIMFLSCLCIYMYIAEEYLKNRRFTEVPAYLAVLLLHLLLEFH